MTYRYKKKNPNDRRLKHSQYWDAVKLKDGGIIWVIKSKRKDYSKKKKVI